MIPHSSDNWTKINRKRRMLMRRKEGGRTLPIIGVIHTQASDEMDEDGMFELWREVR